MCNVRDAHFYASWNGSILLFLSLSSSVCLCARFLFVRRCGGEKEAFIVLSVRYWNTRGMIVRGESGTSGWKMESRLARRLFLPCRLITSCKHPRLAVNLLKMHAMRFFYPFFFFFLFSLLLFFSFSLTRLRVETSEHFFRRLRGEFKEIVFRRNTVFSIRVTRSLDLPFPKRRKFNKRIATNCSSAIQ